MGEQEKVSKYLSNRETEMKALVNIILKIIENPKLLKRKTKVESSNTK